LVMTGFWRGEEEAIIRHDLTPTIWEWGHIELLEGAADRMGLKKPVAVHLKVDTGMARLGASIPDLAMLANVIKTAQHVRLEGLYSHIASSEVVDAPDVDAQLSRFEDAVTTVVESGLSPIYYHLANTSAITTRPRSWKNMVRPGLALYGYYLPFSTASGKAPENAYALPVRPALSWKTRIMAMRDVPAHQPVGYNGTYVTQAPARIAVLPVGYADGFNRQLSHGGRVIVRNEYAPIVGNVSMDLTTIDVTGIPGVGIGDEVTLIGGNERRFIGAWEHASLASTVAYEILCGISKRVPRRYVE
jgi:alanine racemase